ncbi:hypothetical protein [Sanguibacter sp. Z1732]|uniref:hypothetical protein n=1 Tax=Sanguibacter sp. Z1732 TaxID=3435412 RepID=UPI003D9CA666
MGDDLNRGSAGRDPLVKVGDAGSDDRLNVTDPGVDLLDLVRVGDGAAKSVRNVG